MVSLSKSNSITTAASLPTTHPSWPGSIATTCGAVNFMVQPSAYWIWTSPRTRNPTWACMHRSVPTRVFMCVDHRNPGGYTMRLTRQAPALTTSNRTPPISRRSAPFRGAIIGSLALMLVSSVRCSFFENRCAILHEFWVLSPRFIPSRGNRSELVERTRSTISRKSSDGPVGGLHSTYIRRQGWRLLYVPGNVDVSGQHGRDEDFDAQYAVHRRRQSSEHYSNRQCSRSQPGRHQCRHPHVLFSGRGSCSDSHGLQHLQRTGFGDRGV